MVAANSDRPGDQRAHLYVKAVAKRARRANLAVESRLVGIQVTWSVALIAGTGVTVMQAFRQSENWLGHNSALITALLGFVVVVAQGADRLLGRTAAGAAPDDVLRRGLARERRLFDAGEGPYKGSDDSFSVFVERVENLLAANDYAVMAYNRQLFAERER